MLLKVKYPQTLDEVIYEYYGKLDLFHEVVVLNPNALNYEVLPVGFEIVLPSIREKEAVANKNQVVNLWD